MNLITLDFETYFNSDYTLSKMTTEEYIRDSRFKAHCVGLHGHGATEVIPTIDPMRAAGIAESGVICHHAQFDALILSHHCNIRPAMWFDTLSMARLVFPHAKSHSLGALAEMLGIGKKDVPYESFKGVRDLSPELYNRVAAGCAQDVELTCAIFTKLLPYVPAEELRIIDLTIRMFTEPTLVLDRERMQAYLEKTQQAKEALLSQLGVAKSELQSSERFAALLRAAGQEPPVKVSPSDPDKQIYAFAKTDDGMKNLLESPDETIATLAGARLGQKSTIGETRAQRLLDMSGRGALPVYLKYCGAHTTRWSGGDAVNWQNFTRGSELRLSIMAPEGYRLVIGDLAQIEFRMEMWLAGEERELMALRAGQDVYCAAASGFYGRGITKADKLERQLFKTVLLGCGYGMGPEKFASVLKQQKLEGDAEYLVKYYRTTHPAIVQLWKYADKVLGFLYAGDHDFMWGPMRVCGKRIYLPNGAPLDYSNLTCDGKEFTAHGRAATAKIYGAKLVENVIQALSRVVLSQAMLKMAPRGRIVLTCHDEVVCLAKEEEAAGMLEFVLATLRTPPAWCPDLPLDAEGVHDARYSK